MKGHDLKGELGDKSGFGCFPASKQSKRALVFEVERFDPALVLTGKHDLCLSEVAEDHVWVALPECAACTHQT